MTHCNTPPLVSVIIPAFNRETTILAAVESALAQSYPALEVIVVDDGSTDGTAQRVQERYGDEPRVRCVRQPNGGAGAARNHGMREARGDLLALLDSDDTWTPWKIELQVAILRALPEAGLVWTDMRGVRPDGEVFSESYLRPFFRSYCFWREDQLFDKQYWLSELRPGYNSPVGDVRILTGDLYPAIITGNLVATPTVLMRRKRLRQSGEFDPRLQHGGEDHDFFVRACRAGRVAFCDIATLDYRVGTDDALSNDANMLHLAQAFYKLLSRELREHPDRATLPPEVSRAVHAKAHTWLGRQCLRHGHRAEASRHLAASLRYRWSVWNVLFLLASLTPPIFGRSVYERLRTLRKRDATT